MKQRRPPDPRDAWPPPPGAGIPTLAADPARPGPVRPAPLLDRIDEFEERHPVLVTAIYAALVFAVFFALDQLLCCLREP
jgi:hypothetical protein